VPGFTAGQRSSRSRKRKGIGRTGRAGRVRVGRRGVGLQRPFRGAASGPRLGRCKSAPLRNGVRPGEILSGRFRENQHEPGWAERLGACAGGRLGALLSRVVPWGKGGAPRRRRRQRGHRARGAERCSRSSGPGRRCGRRRRRWARRSLRNLAPGDAWPEQGGRGPELIRAGSEPSRRGSEPAERRSEPAPARREPAGARSEPGDRGRERGRPGSQRGDRGSEQASPRSERGNRRSERAAPGSEGGDRRSEQADRGSQRGRRGSEPGWRGSERGGGRGGGDRRRLPPAL